MTTTALESLPPLRPEEVAGLGAALAAVLANLHDDGGAHGAVVPSNVAVDGGGMPVLSRAGAAGANAAQDVRQLAELVRWLLLRHQPPPRRRRVRLRRDHDEPSPAELVRAAVDPGLAAEPELRPPAAVLRDALAHVPGARLPGAPEPGAVDDMDDDRRRRVVIATAAAGCAGLLAVGMVAVAGRSQGGTTPQVGGHLLHGCDHPAGRWRGDLDGDGCEEALDVTDGVVRTPAGRLSLGGLGHEVATGDWDCDAAATPVVLRLATGEVFAFERWAATGERVHGVPLAVVPGATALRALDRDGDGCDDLVAIRADGSATEIEGPA